MKHTENYKRITSHLRRCKRRACHKTVGALVARVAAGEARRARVAARRIAAVAERRRRVATGGRAVSRSESD